MRRTLLLVLLSVLAVPTIAEAEVRILDPSGAVLATAVRDNETRLLGWTEDGSGLLVIRGGKASRVAASGGALEPVPALDRAKQLGPGGRSAIYRDYPTTLTLRGTDGRVVARLAPEDPAFETVSPEVAWSPDGGRAAVVVVDHLIVLDADTGATVATPSVAGIDARSLSPQAFSPDGSSLVLLAGADVIRVDLATGASNVLETLPKDDWSAPAWSSGGSIAVSASDRVRLVGDAPDDMPTRGWFPTPRWSPDGSVLTSNQWLDAGPCATEAGLTTIAPGSPARTLLRVDGSITGWAWSADSGRLAVSFRRHVEHRGKRHPWPRSIPKRYEMLTRRGDRAVRALVLRVTRGLRQGAGRAKTMQRLRAGLDRLNPRFDEAQDSAVQEDVAIVISRWLRAAGFHGIGSLDALEC